MGKDGKGTERGWEEDGKRNVRREEDNKRRR